jgi:hypothetical protein
VILRECKLRSPHRSGVRYNCARFRVHLKYRAFNKVVLAFGKQQLQAPVISFQSPDQYRAKLRESCPPRSVARPRCSRPIGSVRLLDCTDPSTVMQKVVESCRTGTRGSSCRSAACPSLSRRVSKVQPALARATLPRTARNRLHPPPACHLLKFFVGAGIPVATITVGFKTQQPPQKLPLPRGSVDVLEP